jgi:hypothetical protein
LAREPDGFDFDPPMPPYIQLGPTLVVYLEDGGIEDINRTDALPANEHKIFLMLVYQFCLSSRGYLPTWQIARWLFGKNYRAMKQTDHLIAVYVSKIRSRLGSKNYILCCRNKGYKLHIPHGSCIVPARMIWKLLEKLISH